MNNLIKILKDTLFFIYFYLRNFICWKKNFKNEDSLLSVVVNNKVKEFNYSSSSIINSFNSNINSNWNLLQNKNSKYTTVNTNQEHDLEPNYFKDITPNLIKPKKVYISDQNLCSKNQINYESDRLNFNSNVCIQNELDFLNENDQVNGWENEGDVNLDLESNLRDLRLAERERRIAEHERIKKEKELKKVKSQKTNLLVTKIS